jgi:hypothetical protein
MQLWSLSEAASGTDDSDGVLDHTVQGGESEGRKGGGEVA